MSIRYIDERAFAIHDKDYIQYNHIHINCLPTRVRTSRGRRANGENQTCRAGCNITETATHVIQNCFRTHGGRVLRHNAVYKILANGLRQKGYNVITEAKLWTIEGLKRPGILAIKDGRAEIIDAQIISGSNSLNNTHNDKIRIYDKASVKAEVLKVYKVPEDRIRVSSCTITWRWIWSSHSAEYFNETLKLPKELLTSLTTRVLQESHMNWTRWSQTTSRTPRQEIG